MQILTIVSLAVLIRIVFCFYIFPVYLSSVGTVGSEFLFDNYYEIALSLLDGQGFSLADGTVVLHRPPLYSLVLTLPVLLTPHDEWHVASMQLTNCLLGGLSVYFTILAAKVIRADSANVSLISGVLVALWPFSIWITKVTITENLLLALVPLAIFLGLKYLKNDRPLTGLSCGGVLGLLCLTHSSYIAFAAGFALAIVLVSSIRTGPAKVFLICIGLVVVVFPWTLRNYSHGFTSIQTATGFGLHYLKGLYYFEQLKSGNAYFANLELKSAKYADNIILEQLELSIDSDADRSDIAKMYAVDSYARQHLFDNLALNIVKMTVKSPIMWFRQQSVPRATVNFIMLIPLLYFAILGLKRERWSVTLPLLIPLVSLTAAFSLVFIEDAPMRYALPMFPMLALLAGMGLKGHKTSIHN